MRSKRPEKRWVHKGEYRALVKERLRHCALGLLMILGGLLVTMVRLGFEWLASGPQPPPVQQAPHHPLTLGQILGITVAVLFVLLLLFVEYGELLTAIYQSFKAAVEVESVHVISSRNHRLAPPEECLVRASDLPPTQHQAELLRAATTGRETPPEELLRAAQQNRQD